MNCTQHKIKIFKTDRGGEFCSAPFVNYLNEKGITHEMGTPETPQQNSVVEQFNQTIAERLRTQLIHSNLPLCLWGEVILATSLSTNLFPSKSITAPCPEHAWQSQALGIEKPAPPYS